ncbi:Alpha/Beta hydrolase protein [Lasiosphaeria miniovina]|uniref:Protein phosphatase methylesterase 1 n=1 Tax=Lasiosphaeria miniovina TaxID=1954250 RepID=A0AA40BH96_9PEZI|nr:Alpha/Beta hydrolase protein [Lasiosphaeria miniovina]KAK0734159.1 Alpha/Beta hydrolase protein [Lasiosphaeria miniovina]
MSHLQKKWAKARISSAMAGEANMVLDEADEDRAFHFHHALTQTQTPQDDDSASSSSMSSTGTVIPSPSRALFARPQGFAGGRSLDPIPWTTYFERELFLPSVATTATRISEDSTTAITTTATITHHVYLTSPAAGGKGPLFVMHHGAGSSGLSFAVLSAEIRKRLPIPDLGLDTLATDLQRVVELTQAAMKWGELPPVILVGHSLGGAVVTELARRNGSGGVGTNLLGYAVLDVVEGSAMDALQSMQTYLSTRPQGFASLRDGIDWHVRSRTVRNSVSARTSVPALLVDKTPAAAAAAEEEAAGQSVRSRDAGSGSGDGDGDGDGDGEAMMVALAAAAAKHRKKPWRWRTNLAATQPFWEDWFFGLSKKFLEGRGGKLLLLAGTDRLDTELTIGQMQGKYALQVFPEAGHFIHEDLPEKTAMALVDFYRRNDRSTLVLPPKVSDLLAQGKRV